MKKYIFILFIIMFPFSTFAVEGTCAWHGGVDCSVGPDWDGSAICMDGWRNSSEFYYDQKQCTKDMHHCSSQTANSLNVKYKLNDLTLETSNKCKIPDELLYQNNNDSLSVSREKTIQTLELSAQCASAQNNYRLALTQYYRECYAIGETEYNQTVNKLYDSINQQGLESEKFNKTNIVIISSPYQNIRERKIYKDVRLNYTMNMELGCSKLGLSDEDLAMCEAFAIDPNKNSWLLIDRPEAKIVTTQSLLEERTKQEATKNNDKVTPQDVIKVDTSPLVNNKNINKAEKSKVLEDKVKIASSTDNPDPMVNIDTPSKSITTPEIKKESILRRLGDWFKSLFK